MLPQVTARLLRWCLTHAFIACAIFLGAQPDSMKGITVLPLSTNDTLLVEGEWTIIETNRLLSVAQVICMDKDSTVLSLRTGLRKDYAMETSDTMPEQWLAKYYQFIETSNNSAGHWNGWTVMTKLPDPPGGNPILSKATTRSGDEHFTLFGVFEEFVVVFSISSPHLTNAEEQLILLNTFRRNQRR